MSYIITLLFIRISVSSSMQDQVLVIHQQFMKTFDQMMDIAAKASADLSYQQQFRVSPSFKSNETLSMNETLQISSIFKHYLQDQMHQYSFEYFTDAATNRNKNYYVWIDHDRVWKNHSSGHELYNEIDAKSANLNLIVEKLENTYLMLIYPSKQGLEKRGIPFLQMLNKSNNIVKWTKPKISNGPSQGYQMNAGHFKGKPPVKNNVETKDQGIWGNMFSESGTFMVKGRLAQKSTSRPFKQVCEDMQVAWKIYSHPLVKPFIAKSKKTKPSNVKSGIRKKIKVAWKAANHPRVKPHIQHYMKLNRQQYLSLDSKARQAAAIELQGIRDRLKLGETVLDTISSIFNIFK